jgi:hypothetical protein
MMQKEGTKVLNFNGSKRNLFGFWVVGVARTRRRFLL